MSIANSGAKGDPVLVSWAILPTAKAACCQCVRLLAIMGTIVVLPLLADDLVVTGPMTITASDLTYENRNIRVEAGGELTVRGPHVFAEVTLTDNGMMNYARENPDDFLSATGLALHDSARFLLGGGTRVQVTGAVILNGTSQLQVGSVGYGATVGGVWQGVGSQIEAASITVAQDAVITADYQGYGSAGAYNAGGSGPGAGGGGTGDKGGGGGGGYGGAGGHGRNSAGGGAYGDWSAPLELGSGAGSGWYGYGYCRAGGAIRLTAPLVTIDGTVSANGQDGSRDVGGGAGGSIFIEATTLTGGGLLRANGGAAAGYCGGGGGGRIAVHYADAGDFTGFQNCTATGGSGGWSSGTAGSVVFMDTTSVPADVTVYSTFNVGSAVQASRLGFAAGATARIDAPVNAITIHACGADNLVFLDSVTVSDGWFEDHAAAEFRKGLEMETLEISSSAQVTIQGRQRVTGNSLLVQTGGRLLCESADYAGQVEGLWVGTGPTIAVTAVTVAVTGAITADATGYGSAGGYNSTGVGPGGGQAGTVSGGGGGGGHGGRGGNGKIGGGGETYGDEANPVDLGSGAGSGFWANGYFRAGGAVHLEVDALNLDGTISANGAHGGRDVGGGAGGSILVEANTLRGAGTFHSNGGNGSDTCGGGGGGRIALLCTDMTDYTGLAKSTVNGGTGWQNGDRGTIYPAGGLTVNIEPAEAVAAGAKWNTDGAVWRDAAQTIMLAPGDYAVQFAPISGWHTPASQDVVVSQSSFLVVPASYSPIIFRTLTYTAGTNGSVDGEGQVTQSVEDGMSGEPVLAIADADYRFVQWSDGSTANPRIDANVTANLAVEAEFELKWVQEITFDPLPDKCYGDAPFAVSAVASSGLPVALVSDNQAVATVTAARGEWTIAIHQVGTAVLTASQPGNADWAATALQRTITVGKALLNVQAHDQTRLYGDPNPSFSLSIDGFVHGETAAVLSAVPVADCEATAHSPAGTYPIMPGGGAAANYDFHYLNGTLTVLAGKRFHLWATPDSAAPTALQFGQAETASSDFDPDWDAVAAQDAVAWLDNPLVTDPEKRLLNKDFRLLAGLSRWRLVLAEDGGHSAVTLTWDVEAATDGYAMYLQEIRGERPIGFPTDMHAVDNLETVAGATFEIVCGEPQNLEIPLHRGWNCIGTSLFGMASLGQLAGQPAADGIHLPAWLWNGKAYAAVDGLVPFLPECAYLVYCSTDTAMLQITGLPADGLLRLQPGWNCVSPAADIPMPDHANILMPAWLWQTQPVGAYRRVWAGGSLKAGYGYWVYVRSPGPILVNFR